MGFVADMNARGNGMYPLQAEFFALDLPHRLPLLLAVHLLPAGPRWTTGCSFVFVLLP